MLQREKDRAISKQCFCIEKAKKRRIDVEALEETEYSKKYISIHLKFILK